MYYVRATIACVRKTIRLLVCTAWHHRHCHRRPLGHTIIKLNREHYLCVNCDMPTVAVAASAATECQMPNADCSAVVNIVGHIFMCEFVCVCVRVPFSCTFRTLYCDFILVFSSLQSPWCYLLLRVHEYPTEHQLGIDVLWASHCRLYRSCAMCRCQQVVKYG